LEGVVLSTCNRVEVYAAVSKFHGGALDLRNLLAEFCHLSPEEFNDHLYTYHDDGAVRHLFRVAAGIDSMVVGESEILGQVRRAYQVAHEEGMVHGVLGRAFRQALRVGKRVRNETAIGRNPVSVSSAAVELARRAFDDKTLSGKRVVIVGAGKMGRLALRALAAAGASDVTVVNRTEERAQELAKLIGARAHALDDVEDVLVDGDIVICSTNSTQALIERSLIERVVARRGEGPPLFIIDIAVPRDVDPSVDGVEGVILRDIDALRGVEASLGGRHGEVSKVEDLIGSEVQRFLDWERATEFAPTAAALVSKADAIRSNELERFRSRLADLSDVQRDAIEHLTRSIVSKMLHSPLKRARDAGSSKQGRAHLSALRELFELDDDDEV
ncbi:MAG: glutamyl-tRNA reductase, partial [Actinomycetota bacterium]